MICGWGLSGKTMRFYSVLINYLFQIFCFIIIGLPSHFFHLLPCSIQIACVSLVQHVASWVGETAQNYNNECREREEDNEKEGMVVRRRRRSRN
jgi:hypothetical protein